MARSRKSDRRRHPCGKIVQEGLENRGGPTALRRAKDWVISHSNYPELGTVLGRLYLEGYISSQAFDAGCKFAFLRAKCDHAMGYPSRNPKALAFDAARGLSLADEDAEYIEAVVTAFEQAEVAIGLHSRTLDAVENVVIYDREVVGYEEKLSLKEGLERLVRYWRLQ